MALILKAVFSCFQEPKKQRLIMYDIEVGAATIGNNWQKVATIGKRKKRLKATKYDRSIWV